MNQVVIDLLFLLLARFMPRQARSSLQERFFQGGPWLGFEDDRILDVRVFYCLSEIVFDDVQVAASGLDGAVAEDLLHDANADARAQDVRRCVVAKRVWV